MLLTRLVLRNFLAYQAEQTIDFQGIGLAALSGPNGAGKTSLLDAVTWALWGKARARSDDELIHSGEIEMSVSVEFAHMNARYRVTRKRNKKGAELHLHTLAADGSGQHAISESTMRETQQKIIQLLRLDYETFINSAFLQQGKADSFTLKTPGERKKILAEILGLKAWEDYEKAAKEKVDGLKNDLEVNQREIQRYEAEEKTEPHLREQLDRVTVIAQDAAVRYDAANQQFDQVRGAADRQKAAQTRLLDVQRSIQQRQRDLAGLAIDIQNQEGKRAKAWDVLANAESIEQDYTELLRAREWDEALYKRSKQAAEAQKQLDTLDRRLENARQQLERDAARHRENLQDVERLAAQSEQFDSELAELNEQIAKLEKQQVEHDALQMQIGAHEGEISGLSTVNQTLKNDMDALNKRLKMLEAADGHAQCPVCGQPLNAAHKADILMQYQADGKTRGDQFRSNERQIKLLTGQVTQIKQAVLNFEKDLRRLDKLRTERGQTTEKLKNAQDSAVRVDEIAHALQTITEVLDSDAYESDLRAQIDMAHTDRLAIGYDQTEHDDVRARVRELGEYEHHKHALDSAAEGLPQIEALLVTYYERREQWQAEWVQLGSDEQDQRRALADCEAQAKEEARWFAEVKRRRIEQREADDDKIVVEQRLKAIIDARQHKQALIATREALTLTCTQYQQLREAFSKNGVPAMIIDAAVPELESTANELLSRISDGRMNVRFDTQKENKSGTVSETLDILISDELGTRDYAMYSGGEGFRVNFAIRVALSQFLARRAGAELKTLFIDEGFGSQDEVGRERLLEAINIIRDRFDLILVVTHIDELREAFPVHIRIAKGDNGSRVTVV